MAKISRREARTCAVIAMFGAEFQKDTDAGEYFDLVCVEGEIPNNDFSKELFVGAFSHIPEIDEAISKYSKGWKIDRMAKMSLAVMRIAVYELLFTDTPAPIVINEALEIDKKYDSDDAPAFVNGILNAAIKGEGLME